MYQNINVSVSDGKNLLFTSGSHSVEITLSSFKGIMANSKIHFTQKAEKKEDKSAFRLSIIEQDKSNQNYTLYVSNIISYKGNIEQYDENLRKILTAKSMWKKIDSISAGDADQIKIDLDGSLGVIFTINDESLYYKSLNTKYRGKPICLINQNQKQQLDSIKAIKEGSNKLKNSLEEVIKFISNFLDNKVEDVIQGILNKINLDEILGQISEKLKNIKKEDFKLDEIIEQVKAEFKKFDRNKTVLELINELISKINPTFFNQNNNLKEQLHSSGEYLGNLANGILNNSSENNKALLLYLIQKFKASDAFTVEFEESDEHKKSDLFDVLEKLFKELEPIINKMNLSEIEEIIKNISDDKAVKNIIEQLKKVFAEETEQDKISATITKIIDLVTKNATLGEILNEINKVLPIDDLKKIFDNSDGSILKILQDNAEKFIDFIKKNIGEEELKGLINKTITSLKDPLKTLLNQINDKPKIKINILSALYRIVHKNDKNAEITSYKELISFGLSSVITLGVPFLNEILKQLPIPGLKEIEVTKDAIEEIINFIEKIINNNDTRNTKIFSMIRESKIQNETSESKIVEFRWIDFISDIAWIFNRVLSLWPRRNRDWIRTIDLLLICTMIINNTLSWISFFHADEESSTEESSTEKSSILYKISYIAYIGFAGGLLPLVGIGKMFLIYRCDYVIEDGEYQPNVDVNDALIKYYKWFDIVSCCLYFTSNLTKPLKKDVYDIEFLTVMLILVTICDVFDVLTPQQGLFPLRFWGRILVWLGYHVPTILKYFLSIVWCIVAAVLCLISVIIAYRMGFMNGINLQGNNANHIAAQNNGNGNANEIEMLERNDEEQLPE